MAALLALVFVVAWTPGVAMAAGRPARVQTEAEALKTQADRAMDALHYDDALLGYRKAYEISKSPALLYNQARAYQALGDYASALDYLERFENEASPALKSHVPDLKGLDDDLRGKVSTLTLTSNAVGAEVVLQDKIIGTTPLPGPIRTTSGHVVLVIHGEKYQEYRRELDLVGGQATTVEATLSPKDVSTVLLVRSGVTGAHVSLDGKLRGDAPLELVTLPGLHTIRLERSGYETTDTSAVLAPASRKEIDVPMVKGTPVYARWWLWTAVGVAIAGGITTYFVLTTERSPDHGSISPGVISAPQSPASLRF
jgi:PEGA domain